MKKITKQSKIRLVELQATQFGKLDSSPSYDFYSIVKLPPRALPNLSAVLKSDGFTDVKMLSPMFHGKSGRFTPKNYEDINTSDVVLISSITRTTPQSLELADRIKKNNPNIHIIFGGMHATYRPEESLNHGDIVVIKEGEKGILDVMNGLIENPSNMEYIKGIAIKKNNGIIITPERELMSKEEFGSLPLPYYDKAIIKGVRTSVVEQARGCPHNCDFCSVTKTYGRKIRTSSDEKVISELKLIKERKMGWGVFFTGDNMAGTPKKSKKLLDKITEVGLSKPLKIAQASAGLAKHPDLIESMIKAGINRICVGFESIYDDSLKSMNKPFTAKENTEAAKTFREYGLWTNAMMMITENDTLKRIKETVEWCKENADSMQMFIKSPLPGTPFYDRMKEEGRILTDDFSLYDAQHCIVKPSNMSPYDLQMGVIQGYLDFYSVKSTRERYKRSPIKKYTLEFTAYALGGGLNKVLKSPQTIKYLDDLKSIS